MNTHKLQNSSLSPCANVRRTSHALMIDDEYWNRSVTIDNQKLDSLASNIAQRIEEETTVSNFSSWDEFGWHYVGRVQDTSEVRAERVALYVLTLDALNFCFWPTPDRTKIPYEHLAVALKEVIESWEQEVKVGKSNDGGDSFPLSPLRLASLSVGEFKSMLAMNMPVMLPEMSERCRLLNELGYSLMLHHEGSAMKMIRKARQSAECLVSILIDSFPGFRDACVDCQGRQAFFYKRAQIAVADLWAAFKCLPDQISKPCDFMDMSKITTFADYRVPQLLRHYGVMVYDKALAEQVNNLKDIPAGSMDELFIRAATVVSVELLVKRVRELSSIARKDELNDVQMDWHLWQVGEKMDWVDTLLPHHCTRTIFY